MLPTYSDFGPDALPHQLADQEIEADAMAADDDEVGGLELLPEKLDRHRRSGIEDFRVLVDGDEAIRAAERRHRARALAHRIGGEARLPLNQANQQVLGASALGVDPHRQRRIHDAAALDGQARVTRESPEPRIRGR